MGFHVKEDVGEIKTTQYHPPEDGMHGKFLARYSEVIHQEDECSHHGQAEDHEHGRGIRHTGMLGHLLEQDVDNAVAKKYDHRKKPRPVIAPVLVLSLVPADAAQDTHH